MRTYVCASMSQSFKENHERGRKCLKGAMTQVVMGYVSLESRKQAELAGKRKGNYLAGWFFFFLITWIFLYLFLLDVISCHVGSETRDLGHSGKLFYHSTTSLVPSAVRQSLILWLSFISNCDSPAQCLQNTRITGPITEWSSNWHYKAQPILLYKKYKIQNLLCLPVWYI